MQLSREERQAVAYLELAASMHEMVANTDQDLAEEQVRIRLEAARELRNAAQAIRRGEHRSGEHRTE